MTKSKKARQKAKRLQQEQRKKEKEEAKELAERRAVLGSDMVVDDVIGVEEEEETNGRSKGGRGHRKGKGRKGGKGGKQEPTEKAVISLGDITYGWDERAFPEIDYSQCAHLSRAKPEYLEKLRSQLSLKQCKQCEECNALPKPPRSAKKLDKYLKRHPEAHHFLDNDIEFGKGANRWDGTLHMCLLCCVSACGAKSTHQHALSHYAMHPRHCLALNLKTMDVFCYHCQAYVVEKKTAAATTMSADTDHEDKGDKQGTAKEDDNNTETQEQGTTQDAQQETSQEANPETNSKPEDTAAAEGDDTKPSTTQETESEQQGKEDGEEQQQETEGTQDQDQDEEDKGEVEETQYERSKEAMEAWTQVLQCVEVVTDVKDEREERHNRNVHKNQGKSNKKNKQQHGKRGKNKRGKHQGFVYTWEDVQLYDAQGEAGVKGLANLGNSCFFNSAMQVLTHTYPLRNLLLDSQQMNMGSDEAMFENMMVMSALESGAYTSYTPVLGGTRGLLVRHLRAFMEQMWAPEHSNSHFFSPEELFEAVTLRAPSFRGYYQQDSHELLRTLLNLVHIEEAKRSKRQLLSLYRQQNPEALSDDEDMNYEEWVAQYVGGGGETQDAQGTAGKKGGKGARKQAHAQGGDGDDEYDGDGEDDNDDGAAAAVAAVIAAEEAEHAEAEAMQAEMEHQQLVEQVAKVDVQDGMGGEMLWQYMELEGKAAKKKKKKDRRKAKQDGRRNEFEYLTMAEDQDSWGAAMDTQAEVKWQKKKQRKARLAAMEEDGDAYDESVGHDEVLPFGKQGNERLLSFVDDLFGGQMVSVVRCQTCGSSYERNDDFMDLSVPMPWVKVQMPSFGGGAGSSGTSSDAQSLANAKRGKQAARAARSKARKARNQAKWLEQEIQAADNKKKQKQQPGKKGKKGKRGGAGDELDDLYDALAHANFAADNGGLGGDDEHDDDDEESSEEESDEELTFHDQDMSMMDIEGSLNVKPGLVEVYDAVILPTGGAVPAVVVHAEDGPEEAAEVIDVDVGAHTWVVVGSHAHASGDALMRTQSGTVVLERRYEHKDGEKSLMRCLGEFARMELLTGDDAYACEACCKQANDESVRREATKQILLRHLPKVLTVHLKRFIFNGHRFDKIGGHVQFGLTLDLGLFMAGEDSTETRQPPVFDLYGVVVHQGGMGGGHYVAYVKTNRPGVDQSPLQALNEATAAGQSSSGNGDEGGEGGARKPAWYLFSDSMVTPVDEEQVLGVEAFMLFYGLRTQD